MQPTKANFNEQQQAAYDALLKFLTTKTKNQIYCLKGYAGTGKTFLISQLVRDITHRKNLKRIAMTAPTNKAVQVLREAASVDGVTYKTIHSLLGLKEHILESGEIEFKPAFKRTDLLSITDFDVLIIDEVSMLNDELFLEVRRFNNRVKIILMGDPAQIPPVGKEDCEPFLNPTEHGIVELQLTQIMRQAEGSAIAEFGQLIRDNLDAVKFVPPSGDDLVARFMPSDRDILKLNMIDAFQSDVDARVIAWTNRKVSEYNRFIRGVKYGKDVAALHPNEKLIMNKPYAVQVGSELEMLSTNQEVTVMDFRESSKEVEGSELPTYFAFVEFTDKNGRRQNSFIEILHESGFAAFQQVLSGLKAAAIESPMDERKQRWEQYYSTLRTFADVSYAYAITAHKAQGSTYEECFVDVNNIRLNENIVERNRILYTAITRAKKRLTVIQ